MVALAGQPTSTTGYASVCPTPPRCAGSGPRFTVDGLPLCAISKNLVHLSPCPPRAGPRTTLRCIVPRGPQSKRPNERTSGARRASLPRDPICAPGCPPGAPAPTSDTPWGQWTDDCDCGCALPRFHSAPPSLSVCDAEVDQIATGSTRRRPILFGSDPTRYGKPLSLPS